MVRFRPNVAALFIRPEGQLLVCERSTFPGSWQFPQGGVDLGETLEQALAREVREEIGLLPEHYEVLRQESGYRYLYRADLLPLSAQARSAGGECESEPARIFRLPLDRTDGI
ncbi:MAG: NUDIX domain-containing protein [Verrucomicrobia bacterium]|nr:MAG: NUDIX domain-containing protein [Verrucomicrobiota bacterium]